MSATLRNWFVFCLVVFIWGSSFVSVKYALQGFGPFWLVAARITTGAIGITLLARPLGIRLPANLREWTFCAIVGLISTTLPFSLISLASEHVPSGSAGLMMSTAPIMVMLISIIALPEETITPTRIVGLGMGFVGTAMVIAGRDDVQALQISEDVGVWPYLALALAATCYAIFTISGRRFPEMPPLTKSWGYLICAAVGALIIAVVVEPFPTNTPGIALGAVFYLGTVATAGGMMLTMWLVRQTSAGFVAQSNYMVPVVAVILGAIMFAEQLGIWQYAGMVLIIVGIAVTERLGRKKAAAA
jgi:drug/metabolite transporter (DMT)-like permease